MSDSKKKVLGISGLLSRFRVFLSRFPAYMRIAILAGSTIVVFKHFVSSRYPISTSGGLFMLGVSSVLIIAWTIRGCYRQGYFKYLSLTNFQLKLFYIFVSWLTAILLVAYSVSLGWKGGGALASLTIICAMILITTTLVTLIISRISLENGSQV